MSFLFLFFLFLLFFLINSFFSSIILILLIGKSNYFTGMALLIVYASLVVTFWFLGESLLNEETNGLMTEVGGVVVFSCCDC